MLRALALLFAASIAVAQPKEIPNPAGPGSGQPFLVADAGGRVYLSWIEPDGDGGHQLRFAVRDGQKWQTKTPASHRPELVRQLGRLSYVSATSQWEARRALAGEIWRIELQLWAQGRSIERYRIVASVVCAKGRAAQRLYRVRIAHTDIGGSRRCLPRPRRKRRGRRQIAPFCETLPCWRSHIR